MIGMTQIRLIKHVSCGYQKCLFKVYTIYLNILHTLIIYSSRSEMLLYHALYIFVSKRPFYQALQMKFCRRKSNQRDQNRFLQYINFSEEEGT